MIYNGENIAFPAKVKISFAKVIESLEKQAKNKDPFVSGPARSLLDECEKYPELRDGFEDLNILKKRKKVIDRLMAQIFPEALLENEIKGVLPPFDFNPFYLSKRFERILENADDFSFNLEGYDKDKMYVYGCQAILGQYYHYGFGPSTPALADIPNKKAGTVRTYRMAFNADMIEMRPTEKAPEITHQDYIELLNNYNDLDLWKKKFPPNSWEMVGIGVANLMDVTFDRSVSQITSNLLVKSQDSYNKVQEGLRDLLNIPDLHIGFLPFEKNKFFNAHKGNMGSVLLGDQDSLACNENLCEFSYHQLIQLREPLVVTEANNFHKLSKSTLSTRFIESGFESYILVPLTDGGDLFGFLELSSKRKYELNPSTMDALNWVMPIISMAIARFKREAQNQIEAIIQEECTTIHPSVKWRFEEEARNYLKAEAENTSPNFKDIIFKDVYPLYGQIDIKGSSEKRNEAIKQDLLKQIKGVRKVLAAALSDTGMPIYDELIHELDGLRDDIRKGLSSGSEQRILEFLKLQIYPVFDHLKDLRERYAKLIDTYLQTLDPHLNTIYEMRKQYDESVNYLNQNLASFLDEKQAEAQKMFPHYFERYKTDGVEYNIYMGQSIAGELPFDPIYLKNLRLWQIMVTCEMETRYKEMRKELKTSLEVSSLILVYNTSLAVHFRMDEKRFDVEGAYNARYEIVKKRVDKAHIKGTKERVTQPGKIAIIYSSDSDAREYKNYIKFLEDKGYVEQNSLEDVELENLQGISGLRALRVKVAYGKKKKISLDKSGFSVDKILEDIGKN